MKTHRTSLVRPASTLKKKIPTTGASSKRCVVFTFSCFDFTVAMETSYSGLIETYRAKLKDAGEEAAELSSRLQEKDADVDRWKQKLSEQQLKFVGQLPFVVDGFR